MGDSQKYRNRKDRFSRAEKDALAPYCVGRGVDLGCGCRKVTDTTWGLDKVRRGKISNINRECEADLVALVEALPIQSEKLDYLVGSHIVEHVVDLIDVLGEWRRALREGGLLALVIPNYEYAVQQKKTMLDIDPDHKHAITPSSWQRLIGLMGGWQQLTCGPAAEDWSFVWAGSKI